MNSKFNSIIHGNESDANKVVASVMRITFYVFSVIYILNLLNIFVIDSGKMTFAYVVSGIVLLLPTLLNKVCGTDRHCLKYIYMVFTALFLLIVTATLSYHVVVIYVYPIALAGMYFNKKITKNATVYTMIVTIAGQIISYRYKLLIDHNFEVLYNFMIYGLLPRFLTLFAMAALMVLLTKRTSNLLEKEVENYNQLLSYNKDMVYGFATLVENRDENTGGHIKRTSIYVNLLSQELKRQGIYSDIIDDKFIERLTQAAPLHDIGKIAVPDNILQKPGKFTSEEYEIMKTHAEKGGNIILDTFAHITDEDFKTMAYQVARFHHEKWNGRGYPQGLSGEKIPLAARIMAVADVFDAVSQNRCYRDALPVQTCFDIIEHGKGTDFDPVLVECFLNIRDEVELVCEQNMGDRILMKAM